MLDAVSQAVVAADDTGAVTHWNAAAELFFGWTAAEALGKPIAELLLNGLMAEDALTLGIALVADDPWPGQITARRSDGTRLLALTAMKSPSSGKIVVSTDLTAPYPITHVRPDSATLTSTQPQEAERAEWLGARWQALVTHSADVATIAAVGTEVFSYVSPAVTRLFGWLPSELVGRPVIDILHPDDIEHLEAALECTRSDPSLHPTVEFRFRCADGSFRWAEQTMTNLSGVPGINGLVSNVRDISDRRATEMALRNAESRFRLIAETAQEGMWVTDPDGKTLYANERMAALLGCLLSDIYALRSDELVTGVTRDDVVATQRRRGQGSEEYELHHVRPDKSARILNVSASPMEENGEYIGSLAMITDVNDGKAAQAAVRHLAYHDSLTGLANRTSLMEHLGGALKGLAPKPTTGLAVLVADLHELKLVNDSLGHAAGDQLLVEVAHRWGAALGAQDMLARIASDEFVVVCDGADEIGALVLADRLLGLLDEPVLLGDRLFAVSAGIGIALATAAGAATNAATLLRQADAALFSAKSKGQGKSVVFTSGLANDARDRLELHNDLKTALRLDQLELRYQPVVELDTGKLLGVEALCRWTHPERGPISPDEFIPLAEKSGLIDSLDRWVLHRACRDGQAMRAAGTLAADAYVAVNVSASKLARPDFESAVHGALNESGLPPQSLVLEVTESAVMNDPDMARAVLEALNELGVEVSIDDFGTGYSSLAYLRRLPFGTLKIDRSFVQHVTRDPGDKAIVTAVIDLAKALGAKTIAEGIEAEADLVLLRQLGCRAGQGFLWSPALAIHDLAALLAGLPEGLFNVQSAAERATRTREKPSDSQAAL